MGLNDRLRQAKVSFIMYGASARLIQPWMPFLWQAALQAKHYAIENEPLQEIP
jgi:hypothetical protein